MALTPSTMLPLGTVAPDFSLPDVVSGKIISPGDSAGKKGLLVMFICRHCPYVKHIREGLAQLARDCQGKGVAVVGINSNDVQNYPDDRPEKMKEEAERYGYTFPYLYDESQEVAKAYHAACTPDLFLFDGDRELVYRGQMDDSRPDNGIPVTGNDIRAALDAVLEGKQQGKDLLVEQQQATAEDRLYLGEATLAKIRSGVLEFDGQPAEPEEYEVEYEEEELTEDAGAIEYEEETDVEDGSPVQDEQAGDENVSAPEETQAL